MTDEKWRTPVKKMPTGTIDISEEDGYGLSHFFDKDNIPFKDRPYFPSDEPTIPICEVCGKKKAQVVRCLISKEDMEMKAMDTSQWKCTECENDD